MLTNNGIEEAMADVIQLWSPSAGVDSASPVSPQTNKRRAHIILSLSLLFVFVLAAGKQTYLPHSFLTPSNPPLLIYSHVFAPQAVLCFHAFFPPSLYAGRSTDSPVYHLLRCVHLSLSLSLNSLLTIQIP